MMTEVIYTSEIQIYKNLIEVLEIVIGFNKQAAVDDNFHVQMEKEVKALAARPVDMEVMWVSNLLYHTICLHGLLEGMIEVKEKQDKDVH